LVSSPRKTFHPYGEEEGSGVNITHLTSINIVNRAMPSVSTGEYAVSFAHEHWIGIGVLNGPNCRLFLGSDSVRCSALTSTRQRSMVERFILSRTSDYTLACSARASLQSMYRSNVILL